MKRSDRGQNRNGAKPQFGTRPDSTQWLNSPSLLNRTLPPRQSPFASSSPKDAPTPPRKRLLSRKRVLLGIVGLVVIGLLLYGGSLISTLDKVFHGNILSDLEALFNPVRLSGESSGRVNILLAGDSSDDPGHAGANLTDSVMVLSIDTKDNRAFMFSIPRDLWVYIPSRGHQKINAANEVTSFGQSGYPSGGMGQLQEIVQNDLGIPINYYALIDYTAFRDAVNAVGGITITINSPDPRGLYDPNVDRAHGGPLRLPNGQVTLNGSQALALAMARGDSAYAYGFPENDITRTQHQRQMLLALFQKAKSGGILVNPIAVTRLVSAIGNNVVTNLSLADVLRLDTLAKKINISSVQSYGLSYSGPSPLLSPTTAPDGESVLVPVAGIDDFSQIHAYYLQLVQSQSQT